MYGSPSYDTNETPPNPRSSRRSGRDSPIMNNNEDNDDDEEEEEEEEYSQDYEVSEETTDDTITGTTTTRMVRVASAGIDTSSSGGGDMGGGGGGEEEDPTSVTATTPTTPRGADATTTTTTTPALPTTPSAAAAANTNSTKIITAVDSLDFLYNCPQLREVANGMMKGGADALSWQLSSAKPGNGVEQIRDASTETYWQSDGVAQPHYIQVHFGRRLQISHVCLYLDYHLDESYTPKTVTIEAGMTAQDLVNAVHPCTKIEFQEPSGWCVIPLQAPPDPLDGDVDDDDDDDDRMEEDKEDEEEDELEEQYNLEKHFQKPLLRAHLIRISILSMHQNGRDTHVRRLALFARQQVSAPPLRVMNLYNTHRQQQQMLLVEQPNAAVEEQEDDHDEFNTTGERQQVNENQSVQRRRQQQQISEFYTESWNHRRNAGAPDFTTLGMNPYSTIR